MGREYTAIIERRSPGWYIAHCLEIPGATGQGPSEQEAQKSLEEAITLFLEDAMGESAAVENTSRSEQTVH